MKRAVNCVAKTLEGAVKGLNKLRELASKCFADHLSLKEKKCVGMLVNKQSKRRAYTTSTSRSTPHLGPDQCANIRRNVKTNIALINGVKDGLATEERVDLLNTFGGPHLNYRMLAISRDS
ncbi:hypothetical protein BV898_11628 [Hypsibius exemplaris]|uniref:Uncharacterized protein n=1 Tax=Hypsibius exemplaris TaxID=2072580 RepID=A0A1W0WG27_HYPEX|nr:hypothetical protein BV898_11628 [Hypsibius exemplaris]